VVLAMIKVLLLIVSILFISNISTAQAVAAGQRGGMLTFGVTDGRKVITRDMGGSLLLRVVKERSVSREHYGWRVEVVRKPYRRSSRNLLYHSRRTLGAHPSQVYAWHVTSAEFPNERALEVLGYPVTVRVVLINPVAEGAGADVRFVSGTIKVSWEREEKGRVVK
jgi:hypothetical protein